MNSEETETNQPSSEYGEGRQEGIRKVPPAPDAIVPTNMEQVRLLLTGRDARFREPLTQREERQYEKVWKQGGKGFTKKQYASSKTMQRKQRQKKKNKWAKERDRKRAERK